MTNRYEDYCDECGKVYRHYYWTQGDTFQNQLSVKNSSGEFIGNDIIRKIEFKLLDGDNNIEYTQEYEYQADTQKWGITIPSEATAKWSEDTHNYRYVITYIDGKVITPVKCLFTVEK